MTATTKTSSERAYLFVKKAILEGQYPSGTRLPEDRIATELGISRTPVRDALRSLIAEGLVVSEPNSGARVAAWSEDELSEISQMRVMLEGYAARLAASKITASQLDELKSLCAQMEAGAKALPRPDLNLVSTANLDFHRRIVAAADNMRLAAAIEPLWHYPVVIRKFALFTPERLERSLSHHREIVSALSERNGDWACSAMQNHLQSARSFDESLAGREVDGAGQLQPAEIAES